MERGGGLMQMLKRVHARHLVEWAKDKPEVLVLSADLTSNTEVDLFRDAYPERFFSLGLTEQNMLSMAGGLAREGFFPFVHTFAVFIYRRAFDQISMSIAYPNLPVRMFGFLPGITTPGGATHQAIDDIGVLRVLPNMTILEAGDASEVEQILEIAHSIPGPVYIRQLRGEVPLLFNPGKPMQLGMARELSQGTDVAVISAGICTEEAMRAIQILTQRGVSIHHLHVSTHKPFNDPCVLEAVAHARYGVISMENHTIIGGLGTEVAEVMAEAGIGKKLVRIGLKDTYAHGASRPYLMREYKLDALALVRAVEKLLETALNVSEDEIKSIRLEPVHGDANPEAL
jgi:transketolase